jgi:hypothetical protein
MSSSSIDIIAAAYIFCSSSSSQLARERERVVKLCTQFNAPALPVVLATR